MRESRGRGIVIIVVVVVVMVMVVVVSDIPQGSVLGPSLFIFMCVILTMTSLGKYLKRYENYKFSPHKR